MGIFRKLAGQTAIYGLSSIVGRLLNYFLVPLYTRVFLPEEYGVVTQLYAYAAFLNIIFTYGLETAYFRFFKSKQGNDNVYSTALISVTLSSIAFAAIIMLLSGPLSGAIDAPGASAYIQWFAMIIAADAIVAIPFARLRQENKAKKFAAIRLTGIFLNILLNLFFLLICPKLLEAGSGWVKHIYDPDFGIGYIFAINLFTSLFTLLLFIPQYFKVGFVFDIRLLKEMLTYSLPLMVAGFAGMINETFDRAMLPLLVADKETAMTQLGIYGACYKLSVIMVLFIQTFRYAAEPFFFAQSEEKNARKVYSEVMHWFIVVCTLIFLAVMLYIDIVKAFIGPEFREGLAIVPVLLLANLCLGVTYNLGVWYKLTGKTGYGAMISVGGAIITVLFNILLIPSFGYMGAAWATLICYASMMMASFFLGQKYYPVEYNLRSFFYYLATAISIWLLSEMFRRYVLPGEAWTLLVNTVFLALFFLMAWLFERSKNGYLRHAFKKATDKTS